MNQNGRSMIEMLGVLAIVGVLSVGGIAGYSKAMQKYRTNKTIEQVTQIANGIRVLYGGQRSYGNVNTKVLQRAKVLPESAFDGNGTSSAGGDTPRLNSAFGGEIEIGPRDKYGNGDGKAFFVKINDIPEDACVELLSQEWGDATGLISYGIGASGYVNNCSDSDDGPWRCGTKGVMTMSQIMKACKSTASQNDITWNFF